MAATNGRTLALSPARRFIGDLVHFAKAVPSVPVERRMNLGPLARARRVAHARISWCTLFVKAYALVASQRSELRRSYLTWPTARLYEHGDNIASVAIEREVEGESAVLFAHLRSPQDKSLIEIETHLQRYKREPVRSFGLFRRALFVAKFPQWLRRLLWWANLSWNGPMRVKRFGTFGISVYAGLGASSLHPLSPLTTALNYGPCDEDGSMDVRLIYDHRVMDGATVARALAHLEATLLGEVLEEVRSIRATRILVTSASLA